MIMMTKFKKKAADYQALGQNDFELCLIVKKACGSTVNEHDSDEHDEAGVRRLAVGP